MYKITNSPLAKQLNYSPIATVMINKKQKELWYNDSYNMKFKAYSSLSDLLINMFQMSADEAISYMFTDNDETLIINVENQNYYLKRYNKPASQFIIISIITEEQFTIAHQSDNEMSQYFFMNIPTPGIIFDFKSHKVCAANEAFLKIVGIPLEHICNMNITSVFSDNAQLLTNYLSVPNPYDKAFLINQYDVSANKTMIFEIIPIIKKEDDNGNYKIFFMMKDIFGEIETQRDQINEDFLRYQFLAKSISDSILIVDNGIITDVNNAACQLWQYSRFELINKPLSLLIPDSAQYINNSTTIRGHSINFLGIKKDKSTFNGSLLMQTFDNLNKKSMVYIVRDLTEHNTVERILRSQNKLARVIFDAQPNLIVVYNEDHIITRCNKVMLDFLGCNSIEEVIHSIGDLPNKFLEEPGFITKKDKENWFILPIEDPRTEYMVAMYNSKHEYNIFNIKSTVLANETETFYIVSFTNITETVEQARCLKEANGIISEFNDELKTEIETNTEMLSQYQKLATIGTMIGFITHQWKQPLNTIGLIAQNTEDILMEEDDIDKEDLASMMSSIMNHVLFMSETMENFKNFFKPEDVSLPFSPTQAIKSIIQLLSPMMRKNNIEFTMDIDPAAEQLKVFGFTNDLKQVIMNIIVNAKDAINTRKITEENLQGSISMAISTDDTNISIIINDNGTGFTEESLNKVFEMHYTTKGNNGSGIGMYMTRMMLDKMNGSIDITNRVDEKGAAIKILLPIYTGDAR